MRNTFIFYVIVLCHFVSTDVFCLENSEPDIQAVKKYRLNVGISGGIRIGEISPDVDAGWTAGLHVESPVGNDLSIKILSNIWVSNAYEDYSSYKEHYYPSGKLIATALSVNLNYKIVFENFYVQIGGGPGYLLIFADLMNESATTRSFGLVEAFTSIGIEISDYVESYVECKKNYSVNIWGLNYDPWLLKIGINYKIY